MQGLVLQDLAPSRCICDTSQFPSKRATVIITDSVAGNGNTYVDTDREALDNAKQGFGNNFGGSQLDAGIPVFDIAGFNATLKIENFSGKLYARASTSGGTPRRINVVVYPLCD